MIPEKQKLSHARCIEILETCETGILAAKGMDEFPYIVPVNYVFANNKIYIHGKSNGTKIQCIEKDSHITFCVIEKAEVIPKEHTTKYSSVLVYGAAKMLNTKEDKYSAINLLMNKIAPGVYTACTEALKHTDIPGLGIIEITPIQITGKKSSE